MKRIFLGFLLNVSLAGGVIASELTAATEEGGNSTQTQSLLTPHLQFLQKQDLTARQMLEKTSLLLNEIYENETQLFYRYMAARDIAPCNVPTQMRAHKSSLRWVKKDGTTGQLTFFTLPEEPSQYLWSATQKLDFKDGDYQSLLISAATRLVMTQLMLHQYQSFHINTQALSCLGLMEQKKEQIRRSAANAQLLIEKHLVEQLQADAKKIPSTGEKTYAHTSLDPELALASRGTDQNLDFLNTEWVTISDLYRCSRWLHIHTLAKNTVPNHQLHQTFDEAILPDHIVTGVIKKSLEDTIVLTAGLLKDTIGRVFLDGKGELIGHEDVIDRFIYLLETYYMFRENNFCRFARLHGKNVWEAPADLFSRRMVIDATLKSGEHALIEINDLDKEHLKDELGKAGITKALAMEMMKVIVYHLGYEAIFRPGYNIHKPVEFESYKPEQVNNLFECYRRIGERAMPSVTKIFSSVLTKHVPYWNSIYSSAITDMGNLKSYELGFHVGYDMKDMVESTFVANEASWGMIAFLFKLDQLSYLNQGLNGPQIQRILDTELTEPETTPVVKTHARAPQKVIQKAIVQQSVATGRNPRLDAARDRLKKKAEAAQNKSPAAKQEKSETKAPAVTQTVPLEAAKKSKKKKKAQLVTIAPVQEVKVIEQAKPLEEAAPVPVAQPTVEELKAELGTHTAKEQQLADELATTKAWNTGLQDEIKDKQNKIAELEAELEDTRAHKQKMIDRLKKVREKAESDLLARDALVNVTILEKKQAEQELRSQLDKVTKELEELKLTSATALKEAREKSASALKAAQEKGARDFHGALYRIKLVKQDTEKAEKAKRAADKSHEETKQKLTAAEAETLSLRSQLAAKIEAGSSHEETTQKLSAAEAEIVALRTQLAAKLEKEAVPVAAVEEIDSLKHQVAQLHEANIAFQDHFARGNEAFAQQMGEKQLELDTATAEVIRLQQLLAKSGVNGSALMPTHRLEVEVALRDKKIETLKAENANLAEQHDNDVLLIRALKQPNGQNSNNSEAK